LFLFAPPTRSLGTVPNIAFAALVALTLVAFLPARWFPLPDWRSILKNLGAHFPPTVSVQPWLTFQSTLQFFLGLSWSYYLMATDWSLIARKKVWNFVALLVVGLAAAIIVANFLQIRIPFWPDTPQFGFFPNRNHTSNVLGIGGILTYALALDGFARRYRHWWIWIAALSIICSALILDYSRSGIILLGLGILTWHFFWLASSNERRRPLIASAGILVLLALLVWGGGQTIMRFVGEESDFLSPGNMRFAIFRDALDLTWRAPVTGIGLRNFGYVFSTAQTHSIAEDVAVHPESDWLWAAVELGWIAPLLIGVLFLWWLQRCFPFAPGTSRLLRFAAMVCGCGFALHAFFDVPGHHIGAILPTILLASTALHPNQPFKHSSVIPIVSRLTGIILLFGAFLWFSSYAGSGKVPTSFGVERWQKEIDRALDQNQYENASSMASRVLKIVPLEWSIYYQRGVAEIGLHSRSTAKRDFAIAHYLLPQWPDLWLKEGTTWALAGEIDEAFESWARMLRHFPQQAPGLYEEIYGVIKDQAEFRDRWRLLGRDNKECLLAFFQHASPVEFRVEMDRLLADDPELKTFDADEKRMFFQTWYNDGDKLELAEVLREKPEWRAIAWKQLARVYADYGDYQNACATVREFGKIPALPEAPPGTTIADLELQARLSPTNTDIAATLCLALAKDGRIEQALARLEALHDVKGLPDYLLNLEAQMFERKGDWGKAWNSLRGFLAN
jgi:hypothetical protein